MLSETQTLCFEVLTLGMTETYVKEVKSSGVVGFAEISGDRNPIHLSEHFAAKTPFGGRIGTRAAISSKLPSKSSNWLKKATA